MAPVDFSVNVHDGPKPLENQGEGDGIPLKNSFEVAFARRALMLVRRLLGSNGIEELLKDEIATSNEFWKKVVAQSKNEWRPARVKLSTRGIKHKEFLDWFLPKNGFILPENIASHPEHWTVYVDKARGGLGVCETLGDKVSWFVLKDDGTKSAFVENDPALPTKFTGRGYLDGENGVQIVETFHQFNAAMSRKLIDTQCRDRDHEDDGGFDADLAVYFPAACGGDLIECHRQHLLVEFSNWFRDCYKALRADGM